MLRREPWRPELRSMPEQLVNERKCIELDDECNLMALMEMRIPLVYHNEVMVEIEHYQGGGRGVYLRWNEKVVNKNYDKELARWERERDKHEKDMIRWYTDHDKWKAEKVKWEESSKKKEIMSLKRRLKELEEK